MTEFLWSLAYFCVEPFTSAAYWLAHKLYLLETHCALNAGAELEDE